MNEVPSSSDLWGWGSVLRKKRWTLYFPDWKGPKPVWDSPIKMENTRSCLCQKVQQMSAAIIIILLSYLFMNIYETPTASPALSFYEVLCRVTEFLVSRSGHWKTASFLMFLFRDSQADSTRSYSASPQHFSLQREGAHWDVVLPESCHADIILFQSSW